jgi:hypothetical protein
MMLSDTSSAHPWRRRGPMVVDRGFARTRGRIASVCTSRFLSGASLLLFHGLGVTGHESDNACLVKIRHTVRLQVQSACVRQRARLRRCHQLCRRVGPGALLWGGHFAALECPEELLADLLGFMSGVIADSKQQ